MSRYWDDDGRIERALIVDRYGPEGVTVLDYLRREHAREGWT